MKPAKKFNCLLSGFILALALISGCMKFSTPAGLSTAISTPSTLTPSIAPLTPPGTTNESDGLSPDQITTLDSLTKVDDYPLYTMQYYADYSQNLPAFSQIVENQFPQLPADVATKHLIGFRVNRV